MTTMQQEIIERIRQRIALARAKYGNLREFEELEKDLAEVESDIKESERARKKYFNEGAS